MELCLGRDGNRTVKNPRYDAAGRTIYENTNDFPEKICHSRGDRNEKNHDVFTLLPSRRSVRSFLINVCSCGFFWF